jgi:hypothetical protein
MDDAIHLHLFPFSLLGVGGFGIVLLAPKIVRLL